MQDLKTETRFNSVLEEYGQLLHNAIAARCPNNIGLNIDDIMQEACLRLWRALSSEREIRDLPSYLYRIAATVTIDAVRRVKARREQQMQLSSEQSGGLEERQEDAQPVDARPSPELATERQWLMEIVQETLSLLPADRRRGVGLYLQGWNTTQIAELMGWSEARARNLVYRGLEDLRGRLRAQGFEYEIE
jgi:RNA polymerase sigma factor (sigma-70 family)